MTSPKAVLKFIKGSSFGPVWKIISNLESRCQSGTTGVFLEASATRRFSMKTSPWTCAAIVLAGALFTSWMVLAAIPPQSVTEYSPARSRADQRATLLERDMLRADSNDERMQSLNRAIADLRYMNENALRETAKDQGYMSLMVAVLDSIPKNKDFKKSDCGKYESDMLNQFEPTAEEEPDDPAVRHGWYVLQALCR
jgi:hypothetical protein